MNTYMIFVSNISTIKYTKKLYLKLTIEDLYMNVSNHYKLIRRAIEQNIF